MGMSTKNLSNHDGIVIGYAKFNYTEHLNTTNPLDLSTKYLRNDLII